MVAPKWKKRLAWSLSLPLALAVIGWLLVSIAEANVGAAIRIQEAKLEALGLRVKPLTPADNAAPDYVAAAKAIRAVGQIQESKEGSGGSWQNQLKADPKIMALLKQAGTRNALVIPMSYNKPNLLYKDVSLVTMWAEGVVSDNRQDIDDIPSRPLADFLCRYQAQSMLGGRSIAFLHFDGVEPVLEQVSFFDFSKANLRAFLRERLTSNEPQTLVRASLSRAILQSRSLLARPKPAPGSGGLSDSLKAFFARSHMLKLNAELELLSAWLKVASNHLGDPRRVGQIRPFDELARRHLQGREGWFASRALLALEAPAWPATFNLELDRRKKMIGLDLLDQFLTGKPLKPTWSAEWMVDPETGKALKLTVRSVENETATLLLSCESPANQWEHEYKLRASLPSL